MAEHATRHRFVRRAVRRFMPGETVDAALEAAGSLAAEGIPTLVTLLGENLVEVSEADAVARHYLDALGQVRAAGLDAELSVKPTQLGLDLDPALCRRHLDALTDAAAQEPRSTVWIDMEGSPYVDPTLELYRSLRERHANVGVCLQAYLYRTAADLEALLPLGPSIRLVKGAYLEPREIAFPDKADVDRSYLALAERLLDALGRGDGLRVGFGTHDPRLIERINAGAAERGTSPAAFEWQMLYGIQREEQRRLARAGYRVRVLISYGAAWYPWYMRRLAERPANLLFVARNVFAR